MPITTNDLAETIGNADIYLIDQVLRGRISQEMRVLDAGCGGGRNALFLLKLGCTLSAVDHNPEAIAAFQGRFDALLGRERLGELTGIERCAIESMPFSEQSFDVVLSNAVLHFAEGEQHFNAMLREMWRVLKVGGLFFARLATTEGLLNLLTPLGERRYRLPTGQEWFLVDVPTLKATSEDLCGELIDPIKSSLVDGQRSMTTWVMRKQ